MFLIRCKKNGEFPLAAVITPALIGETTVKLYIIVAVLLTQRDQDALATFLRPFRSKMKLGDHCWLVAAGGTATTVCNQVEEVLGKDRPVIVAQWRGDTAWTRRSEQLKAWLPRQLAALTN